VLQWLEGRPAAGSRILAAGPSIAPEFAA